MQLKQFDRDMTLGELLKTLSADKLRLALTRTLGNQWRIVDTDGAVLLDVQTAMMPEMNNGAIAVPLRLDIEVAGSLIAFNAEKTLVEAAATWLEMILRSANRYRMASELHLEAVHADYEALQRKHKALQESETRYRELATQLEQRVAAQVKEIEQAQRQLYQSEKMASVGSLAAGMAHEINNPIGFIRSNLATALSYVQKVRDALITCHSGDMRAAENIWIKNDIDFVLEDFPGLITESIHGADRVARIVANLKAYASVDCDTAAPVDLNDTVRTVLGVMQDQLPEGISFETKLRPLPLLLGDQSRMNQMLFSLVQNARQAIRDRGEIFVETQAAHDEIRILVTDNGSGIAPEIVSRIFDPFFTTRDVGKGTGLGLTVSRDIAMAHGGSIEVESKPGSGSTFTVKLPLKGLAQTANRSGPAQ